MKKSNNKGFSLVELIVVVAIMAVLVGVLAPAYLKYVENSREKKDLNNLEEIRHAVEIALADEDVFLQAANGETVTIAATSGDTAGAITANGNTELADELAATVGESVQLVSKEYNVAHTVTIEISSAGTVTVTGDWE